MEHRNYNIGASDYAQRTIQPWDIWKEYDLNPWDADIIKRVLRNKKSASRVEEYEKIIHVCKERISHLTDERSDNTASPSEMRAKIHELVKELWDDTEAAPKERNEEDAEKVEETPHDDTVGRAEKREDNQFSELVEALQKRIGGDAKVSVTGHSDSGISLAIEGCHRDELPPSEELSTIVEKFRPRSS